MKLSIFTDAQALELERDKWDQVAGNRAFFRYSWLMNWYEAMHAERDQVHVIVATDDQDQWIGIVPFFVASGKLTFA